LVAAGQTDRRKQTDSQTQKDPARPGQTQIDTHRHRHRQDGEWVASDFPMLIRAVLVAKFNLKERSLR
jgi:hypothetical protein